jgi:GNAT superfamily N-acetyltransferase
VQLIQIDPATDAESARAAYEIHCAAAPVDDPYEPAMALRSFTAWLTYGWMEDPIQTWLARDGDGQAVGWYQLDLPERENRHLAGVTPVVHPARRRRGLGRALLRHAAGQAKQASRTVLASEVRESSPGEAFARAIGARQQEITEVRRVLELAGVDAKRWTALRQQAEAEAAGYSLEYWEGPVPDDKLAQVAEVNAAMADAPHDHESQLWDAERVRLGQVSQVASGMRSHSFAAHHDASGAMVALTHVVIQPSKPEWGFQGITAVVPAHRGHRLGLLVKARMHELLAGREPQLARITTGNAGANKYMIAINETMGYQVVDDWPSFEMDVEQALALEVTAHAGARAQS